LAWVLVRYNFPGRRFVDALVDIPFALPTAVAGLTLANLYTENGWLGPVPGAAGHPGCVQPAGRRHRPHLCGAAICSAHVAAGAGRHGAGGRGSGGDTRRRPAAHLYQRRGPTLFPTVITGFALAFARAVGEYGSVIFISSNIPRKSEIAPLVIITLLEQYEYTGAMALAVVLLTISFSLLIAINLLERWASRYHQH
jgi:sulfate transport system permease protein